VDRIAYRPWQRSLFILPMLAIPVSLGSAGSAPDAFGWLLLGGLASGLLSGMLGIGGALVTVPVLYLALPQLGVDAASLPHVVVSSALLAMVPTTLAGTWAHRRAGSLDAAWLARLAPGMAAGAVAGALLATQLLGPALALAFATQAMFYGCRLILRRDDATAADRPAGTFVRIARALPPWLAGPVMAAFCACVGMGGATLVNPYLHSQGLALRTSVGTGSTLNLCIALGGCIALLAAADAAPDLIVSPSWTAATLLGGVAMVAAPVGVALARRLALTHLSRAIGAINVAAALTLCAQVA
jgi:uncharacterized membrane protein YfcA